MSAHQAKKLADFLVRMLHESSRASLHTARGAVVATTSSPETAALALEILSAAAEERNADARRRYAGKEHLLDFEPEMRVYLQAPDEGGLALLFYGYGVKPLSDLLG